MPPSRSCSPSPGTTIANGAYMKLKKASSFVSRRVNSSIALVADGVGTMTEVSRKRGVTVFFFEMKSPL